MDLELPIYDAPCFDVGLVKDLTFLIIYHRPLAEPLRVIMRVTIVLLSDNDTRAGDHHFGRGSSLRCIRVMYIKIDGKIGSDTSLYFIHGELIVRHIRHSKYVLAFSAICLRLPGCNMA